MFYQKRGIIATGILFMASSYFMVRFQALPLFSSISGVFMAVFALPSYYYLVRHLGAVKGVFILTLLSVIPVLVEAFAVWTGFPFGGFEYGEKLGGLLFGLVPPSVSFAYLPILLGSLFTASKLSREPFRFSVAASLFNLLVDLVIDPAAVHIGFWSYHGGGLYYGVPLSNFVGWLFTGFLYSALFYVITGRDSLPLPEGVSVSLIWILCFWVGYLSIVGLILPALVGVVLLLSLLKLPDKRHP